jgi:hypothetical protein
MRIEVDPRDFPKAIVLYESDFVKVMEAFAKAVIELMYDEYLSKGEEMPVEHMIWALKDLFEEFVDEAKATGIMCEVGLGKWVLIESSNEFIRFIDRNYDGVEGFLYRFGRRYLEDEDELW